MQNVLIALILIWLLLVIVGFAVKSLLWLAIIGLVLFIATAAYAVMRGTG